MTDLSDSDKERFTELKERLEGVKQAEIDTSSEIQDFTVIDPMLAEPFDGDLESLSSEDWVAERKYDGTRIILEKFKDDVKLFTRRHVERSEEVPEITESGINHLPNGVILDGEVTFMNEDDKSIFIPIHASENEVKERNLRTIYYVFDILARDHEWVTRQSLDERKEILLETLPEVANIRCVSGNTRSFESYYNHLVNQGEEGIIIKRRDSPYYRNTRSTHWRKVKAFDTHHVAVVGYTDGEGTRKSTFGSLVLMDSETYIGRVGSGFTRDELNSLSEQFKEINDRPISPSVVGEGYTPVKPFVVKVKYQEVTENRELRAPVYLGTNEQLTVEDLTPIS